MKPVLMIHEWKDEYKNLPLEDYILTFDDGLYTQYEALPYLKSLDTEKIFFVSTGLVCPDYQYQSTIFITCQEAHQKAFEGNVQNYMTWKQIKEIQDTDKCEIGGHSHSHTHLAKIKSLKNMYEFFKEDTRLMVNRFHDEGIKITKYCLPYNYDNVFNTSLIKKYNFKIYGNERVDINSLI